MKKTVTKIFEKSLIGVLIYLGKRVVNFVLDWAGKKVLYKKTIHDNHETEKPAESAPAETLNDALIKSTSKQGMSLIANLLFKGDTCLICGAPNTGKSILAMQIGLDIAGGKKSMIVPNNDNQVIEPQPVYYYDGEMRDSDIRNRFGENMCKYPNSFLRVKGGEINDLEQLYKDVSQRILKEHPHEDCTVVFDNIACFNKKKRVDAVSNFLLSINKLKAKYEKRGCNLTVLIVMHTAKEYNKYKPLELNDLSGAAEFGRFANSAIALTESRFGNDRKVLKILKYKFGSIPNEVSINRIVSHPYLHFEYESSMSEEAALPTKKSKNVAVRSCMTANSVQAVTEQFSATNNHIIVDNRQDKRRKVTPEVLLRMRQLYNEGKTQQKIAELLHLCRKTVNKYIKPIKPKSIRCESLVAS